MGVLLVLTAVVPVAHADLDSSTSSTSTSSADSIASVEVMPDLPVTEMGAEERICPELPACPEIEKTCPAAVCPIEGDPKVDFGVLSRDAINYIDFLRHEVYFYLDDSSGSKVLKILMEELDRYYFTYRDVPGSEEALYLKSRIYNDDHDYEEQLLCLLKIIYEYPEGAFYKKARSDARALMDKKFKKDYMDSPELFSGGRSIDRSMNQASMIEAFVKLGNKRFLDVQNLAYDEFLAYYPRHIKADLVMTFKSNNFIRRKNYEAAAHTLRRQVAFYPDSPLRPENMYLLGLIYSDELREYKKAVKIFAEIIEVHPNSGQAISSHERSAELYNKKLKANDSAVEMLEDIVEKYPRSEAALRAFTYMAEIQWSDKYYKSSMTSYMRQSEMFAEQPEHAVTALFEAARVADRGLRDKQLYVDTLVSIYENYPSFHRSAAALYEAAKTYESDMKDMESAKKYYAIIRDDFSEHKRVKSAASRLKSIETRERKAEEKRQREIEKQRLKEEAARLKEIEKYEGTK